MRTEDEPENARYNEAAIVMAFYNFASEPENWDQILDIVGKADVKALDILQGHLDQAAELSQKIFNGFEDNELHDADYGILEVDAHSVICASNRTARSLLYDLLGSTQNEADLCFKSEEHQQVYLEARARLKSNNARSTLMRFELEKEKTTLLAVLMSNPENRDNSTEDKGASQRAAARRRYRIVFSPISITTDNSKILRAELGLTQSESRLALQLGAGATVADAAKELNISVHTARNQLKSIYSKTGINRQSELIKLLIELGLLSRILIDQRDLWAAPGTQPDAIASTARKYYILADGRKLAYRFYGKPDGHPVIAFHSGLASIVPLVSQVDSVTKNGLGIYVIERPGFGMSDPCQNYSYESVAADIADFVDGKSMGTISILAEASGAAFGLQSALRLNGAVRSICIAGGVHYMPNVPRERNASFFQFFYHRVNQNPWILKGFWRIFRNGFNHKMGRSLITEFYPPGSTDRAYTENPLIEEQFIQNTRESLVRTSEGVSTEMIYRAGRSPVDISKLSCPILMWHGTDDIHFGIDAIREYMQTAPNPYFRIKENIGHTIMFQCWDEIMQDIASFKAGTPAQYK
ncbi:alpha/beta fold hydrolase [Kordiimonas sp.]|uniref:alpha/beta fold hydrolase n=1 Tax=Kordiimonas sp. TaxID=1970157 RepID=UPI003A93F996